MPFEGVDENEDLRMSSRLRIKLTPYPLPLTPYSLPLTPYPLPLTYFFGRTIGVAGSPSKSGLP